MVRFVDHQHSRASRRRKKRLNVVRCNSQDAFVEFLTQEESAAQFASPLRYQRGRNQHDDTMIGIVL